MDPINPVVRRWIERGQATVLTYAQLLEEVKRAAAALRGLGIHEGDRVAVYMPTCVEAIVLLLALTRIGAIHLVVFAGFGAGALGDRIRLAGAKALFYADLTYRKGKDVPLTGIVEEALASSSVQTVVVLRRGQQPQPAGHLTWTDFMATGQGQATAYEVIEANE